MIKHLITQMWNDRKRFAGMYIEQLLVFVVLMLCVINTTRNIAEYKTPGLLNTENTVVLGLINPTDDYEHIELVQRQMDQICQNLRKLPYVTAISESFAFLPYLRPDDSNPQDSIRIDDKSLYVYIKGSDRYGYDALQPEITEGTWLPGDNLADGTDPAVITRQLADSLDWKSPVGKIINYSGINFTVVGVISGIKQNAFTLSPSALIMPVNSLRKIGYVIGYSEFSARLESDNLRNDFYQNFYKEFNQNISDPNVEPLIFDLQKVKKNTMSDILSRIFLQSIPTIFLVLFGFIGTFGLFWLYSRKRVGEFALRRAVGATKARLVRMVITESVVLTLLAAVPGLLLALFIYSWNWTVVFGIVATLAAMLLFSVFSAWYPAWKVSRVSPAEALHNE